MQKEEEGCCQMCDLQSSSATARQLHSPTAALHLVLPNNKDSGRSGVDLPRWVYRSLTFDKEFSSGPWKSF